MRIVIDKVGKVVEANMDRKILTFEELRLIICKSDDDSSKALSCKSLAQILKWLRVEVTMKCDDFLLLTCLIVDLLSAI